MGKLLFFILAVVVVCAMLKGMGRRLVNRGKGDPSVPPSSLKMDVMVPCAICGVNFPSGEAIPGAGRLFCSEEHLRRFLSRET